jgi:hypothetical protein
MQTIFLVSAYSSHLHNAEEAGVVVESVLPSADSPSASDAGSPASCEMPWP